MQLICVGDIAVSGEDTNHLELKPPTGDILLEDVRIQFNWELPVGSQLNPYPRSSGLRYLSSPESINNLVPWTPGFVSLATNHILDAGVDGLAETLVSLKRVGFETIGAGLTREEITKTITWETSEGVLAIINWVFPETHPDWMETPGANCWPGNQKAQEIIMELKEKVDWVMAILHWSDELFMYPRPEDRMTAHALAGAGLDILIGHHPHVVRGMEVINQCRIFYSLGNYYFSNFKGQKDSWLIKWAPKSLIGLGVKLTFKKGTVPQFESLSFRQVDGKVLADPKEHAGRRLVSVSHPLEKYSGEQYSKWYNHKRKLFDLFGVRWHHGVRRLGVWNYLKSVAVKY